MERQKMMSLSAFIGIAILTIFAGQAAAEATVHQESVKKEIEAIGATGSSPGSRRRTDRRQQAQGLRTLELPEAP
jgi:hypothetical protein